MLQNQLLPVAQALPAVQTKRFTGRRFAAAVIDLAVVFSLATLFQHLLYTVTYSPFDHLFVAFFFAYNFFCHFALAGRTAGKALTGLQVVQKNASALRLTDVLLREVLLKGGAGVLLPLYLLPRFFALWSALHTAVVLVILLVVSGAVLLLFKRPWWELFSGTRTRKAALPRRDKAPFFFTATGLVTACIAVGISPFTIGRQNFHNAFLPSYPKTPVTAKYAAFIKANGKDPVDYVFDLFQKYDVVVLSERMHPEYTQYEFITKLVSDPRFQSEVGNLFTECGSVSFQDTLDTYLHTQFASEHLLNKSTAELQRNSNAVWPLWSNTNLFDLLKTANHLNRNLPDSNKLHWYFTDLPVDWRTMDHAGYLYAYTVANRDSLMAVHFLRNYQKFVAGSRRHKALVIMNTRHGYGLLPAGINDRFRTRIKGTAAFLGEALPGNVATVMLHSFSIKYGMLMTPLQGGKWDRAFAQAGNPSVGFSFAGSPFGNDAFDATFFQPRGVCYKDMFTGFVFYKPLEQHVNKDGFPYEFDGFEDSVLKRAACVNEEQVATIQSMIRRYKKHPGNPVAASASPYAVLHNLVFVWGVPALLFVIWLLSAVLFGWPLKKRPA